MAPSGGGIRPASLHHGPGSPSTTRAVPGGGTSAAAVSLATTARSGFGDMARKQGQRQDHSDSSNRAEHAIPRAIREGSFDDVRMHVLRAQDNGLLVDSVVVGALRTACDVDNVEIVRFLLEHASAAHVNECHAKTKETLLMRAKSKGVAQLLIDHGKQIPLY